MTRPVEALVARFKLRARSWQGPAGAACVVAAVGWLAAPGWALLTVGGFLLLATLTGAG